jgi:hypothetical protein
MASCHSRVLELVVKKVHHKEEATSYIQRTAAVQKGLFPNSAFTFLEDIAQGIRS